MLHLIDRVESFVTKSCLVAIVVIVLLGAVSRYAGMPVRWAPEAAQGLFVWLAVLSANHVLKRKAHVAVDVLSAPIARVPLLQGTLSVVHHVLMLLFCGAVIYYGVLLAQSNMQRLAPSLGISYFWITLAIPVGFALMTLTLVRQVAGVLRGATTQVQPQ